LVSESNGNDRKSVSPPRFFTEGILMIGALGGAVKEDVMNTFDAWNPASVACENQSMNHSGAQPSTRRVVCGGNHIR
jgi:hypothetical protein